MAIKGVIKNSVTADISAEQFASLFESIFGKNGICNVYERLQCVKIDNNTVRLSSGVYNLSGYMVMVENGTNEDFVIDSGTAGLKRNDLLVAEFVRNGLGSGVDVLTFKIVKGTSVVGAASDPALIAQDISAEGTTRQEALYRIMIDGTNITSVVPVAQSIEGISSLLQNPKITGLQINNGLETNYKTQGNGIGIFSSIINAPQIGFLYVIEKDTDKYLIATVFKASFGAIVFASPIAFNGLSIGATNAGGTVLVTGFTNEANAVFTSVANLLGKI